jgi:hypothetical protein
VPMPDGPKKRDSGAPSAGAPEPFGSVGGSGGEPPDRGYG